jgi:hypothetical protein
MDSFNIRKLSNSSRIDDQYWKESHKFRALLMKAIESDNNNIIKTLLKDPKVFKART